MQELLHAVAAIMVAAVTLVWSAVIVLRLLFGL